MTVPRAIEAEVLTVCVLRDADRVVVSVIVAEGDRLPLFSSEGESVNVSENEVLRDPLGSLDNVRLGLSTLRLVVGDCSETEALLLSDVSDAVAVTEGLQTEGVAEMLRVGECSEAETLLLNDVIDAVTV